MLTHGPSCLEGPVTVAREWWAGLPAADPVSSPGHGCGVRAEVVRRVRREIAAGAYDTTEKWEAALDRLLLELEGKHA